jgi:hypothetical protein
MSTPVRGGPDGPLGYAPPRARQAGNGRGNTAVEGSGGLDSPSPLQALEDKPPRIALSLRDDPLSSQDASPLRENPSPLDPLSSRGGSSLRDALSPREGLPPRDSLSSRDTASFRDSRSLRDGLSARDTLSSRGTTSLRDTLSPRDSFSARDSLPPRETTSLRDALSPPRDSLRSRDSLSSRAATSLRDSLSPSDTTPLRDAHARAEPAYRDAGTRSLLDEAAELGLAGSGDTASRWEANSSRASGALPALSADASWKRKKRSSDVFEGDAALKELRSRLATAPAEHTPEPPLAPPKTPIFASAARLTGVVALAAGGALGFLWITSPHGSHSTADQQGEEVALVSLRGIEPSRPGVTADRSPDATPKADPPWATANYTGDAADKAVAPPVVSPPRMPGPPRAPVTRVTMPPAAPPAPAAVAPPPPPPAAAPAPVTPVAAPAATATTTLDRDEIAAMLTRARTFLSSGDVAAARVVLRRAAERDDSQAALALGGTYDPTVLKKLGIISIHADPGKAREWYRKAAALGSADASLRLEQMVQTDR